MLSSASDEPVAPRQSWLMMPLLGAARISQAMAPRKGGVTKLAVIMTRIVRRSGRSVRATSQAIGEATAAAEIATLMQRIRVVTRGSVKAGSEASVTKLASVSVPARSVTA